jgi:hypothetical protein
MTYRVGFNSTRDAITFADGRVIGGGDWGVYDSTDKLAVWHLKHDALVLIDTDGNTGNQAVDAAYAAAAELNDGKDTAKPLSKRVIAEAVKTAAPEEYEALPVGRDNLPSKADLTDLAVTHGVSLDKLED